MKIQFSKIQLGKISDYSMDLSRIMNTLIIPYIIIGIVGIIGYLIIINNIKS